MVLQMTRPTKGPDGVFRIRMGVPKDLRAIIGKVELKESLRTKDAGEAKRAGPGVTARFEAIIANARTGQRVLSDREVAAFCGDWYRREAARWGQNVGRASDWEWSETLLLERWQETETGARDLSPEPDDHVEAAKLLRAAGHPSDPRTAGRVAAGLIEAKLLLARLMQARAAGDWSQDVNPATFPPVVIETVAAVKTGVGDADPRNGPAISALGLRYFAQQEAEGHKRHQVIAQERATVRGFVEVCGDRPAGAYGRGDVSLFLDTLRRLPAVYGRSPKDKGRQWSAIIAEADMQGAERIVEKTVKRHLSALAQFFRSAVDAGHITVAAHAELFAKRRFRPSTGARTQRDAWTPDGLKALFASPIWTGCHPQRRASPGSEIIRDAKFWIPILALFQGCRLEEFADLYGRDISCDAGTWFISMVETAEDSEAGTTRRTLKGSNATRNVPLHPEVLRLGFVEYARAKAPGPNDPLFPDLHPQGRDQRRGPRFTRDFGYYRRKIGVYLAGVGAHSFRHTAITRLRDVATSHQQERHVDFMLGHARGGGEGRERYDKGPALKEAAATLALLKYPELDLSALHLFPLSER